MGRFENMQMPALSLPKGEDLEIGRFEDLEI